MPVLVVSGPLARDDIPSVCERAEYVLRACGHDLVCDISGLEASAVAVEALASVLLTAHRRGRRCIMRGARRELEELIAFMGLDPVLRPVAASGCLETRRQPEEREQPGGVEEEHDPRDPIA